MPDANRTTRLIGRLVTAALLLNGAACISVTTPRFLMPAPQREWKPTLEHARTLAAAGDAMRADSVLAAYAASYPGTPGSRESLYWRALFQLNSGAPRGNAPAMMLDQYVSDPGAEHPVEAATLFRVASRIDSLSRAANALAGKVQVSSGEVVSANSRAADAKADAKAAVADSKDQDAEIRRLRNELASAREELERIKKRLAEPPKKPPVQ